MRRLRDKGYLAMGGQIVDATIVEARPAAADAGREGAVKGGGSARGLVAGPHARRSTATHAGRLKRGRKRPPSEDRHAPRQAVTLAVPMFGYKNHVGIDREHGLIRTLHRHPRRRP